MIVQIILQPHNGSQATANGNFISQTIQITALIDASGKVQITLENNANQNNEKIKINEIEITAGETLIETTELQNSPVINPISIDLDMDGKIDYLSKEEGQVFYDEGTGIASSIAWVSEDDGLLVIDADQSGSINEIKEFAFTEWSDSATTDLQALAEVFDTNQDGLLDEKDESFVDFGVWQDKNSDAQTDPGELYSLKELGIESIELFYKENSEESIEAEGEVEIFGQVNVNYADGSVGLAEDTAFAINALAEEDTSWSQGSEDQFTDQAADINETSGTELTSEVDDQFSSSSPSEVNIATQVEDLLAFTYLESNSLETFADAIEPTVQEIESQVTYENGQSPSMLVSELMNLLDEPTALVKDTFGINNYEQLLEQEQISSNIDGKEIDGSEFNSSTEEQSFDESSIESNNDDYDAMVGEDSIMDDYSTILD